MTENFTSITNSSGINERIAFNISIWWLKLLKQATVALCHGYTKQNEMKKIPLNSLWMSFTFSRPSPLEVLDEFDLKCDEQKDVFVDSSSSTSNIPLVNEYVCNWVKKAFCHIVIVIASKPMCTRTITNQITHKKTKLKESKTKKNTKNLGVCCKIMGKKCDATSRIKCEFFYSTRYFFAFIRLYITLNAVFSLSFFFPFARTQLLQYLMALIVNYSPAAKFLTGKITVWNKKRGYSQRANPLTTVEIRFYLRSIVDHI